MLFRKIEEIIFGKLNSGRGLDKISSISISGVQIYFGKSQTERIDELVDKEFYGFSSTESVIPDLFHWKSTRYWLTSKEAGIKLILRRSINDAPDYRDQTTNTRTSAELKTRQYKNKYEGNYNLETQDYHVLSTAINYAS